METLKAGQSTLNHYNQRTYGSSGEKAQLLRDSGPEVQREAYKVNWKIAVPLLILGIVPGLIYLGAIALLNCLGGKEVKVEQNSHMDARIHGRSTTSFQSADTIPSREESRREVSRSAATTRTESSVILEGPKGKSSKASTRDRKKKSRNPESSHGKSTRSSQIAQPKPSTTSATIPAPIRENREPRGSKEEVEVKQYIGRLVINSSTFKGDSNRIKGMEQMAKSLRYSKNAEPGTFQGYLKQMYGTTYASLQRQGKI